MERMVYIEEIAVVSPIDPVNGTVLAFTRASRRHELDANRGKVSLLGSAKQALRDHNADLGPRRVLQLCVQELLQRIRDLVEVVRIDVLVRNEIVHNRLVDEDNAHDGRALRPPALAPRARRVLRAREDGHGADDLGRCRAVERGRLGEELEGVRPVEHVLEQFDDDSELAVAGDDLCVLRRLLLRVKERCEQPAGELLRGGVVAVVDLEALARCDALSDGGGRINLDACRLIRVV